MNKSIMTIIVFTIASLFVQYAIAEPIPDWIKNNAGWWADDTIDDNSFVQGIQFLIKEGILSVPTTPVSDETFNEVPDWIKNNAGWWSEGIINDKEFLSGIQHLIKVGIIVINVEESKTQKESSNNDTVLESFQDELNACQEIVKAYKRLNCEKEVEAKIEYRYYKNNSEIYQVGPVTFYYTGLGTEGNELFMEGDQSILTVRMLAENSGSSDNVSLFCTGPAICAYDVWDGTKAFKYSGMDFTSGQIVLKPGDSRVFNMVFGPDIGYGGTEFMYDSSKEYIFRIQESWGSTNIPLHLE